MEEEIMDVAAGMMVLWAYVIVFLTFDEDRRPPSKATSYLTAAFLVVAIIL